MRAPITSPEPQERTLPDPERLVVLHSFPIWLPQTQTWMHTQVRSFPEQVQAHVVCDRTEHLDEFWVPHLHSASEEKAGRLLGAMVPRRWPGLKSAAFLALTSLRLRARILHSHFGDVGWADMRAARIARLKQVVSFYGCDLSLPGPAWRRRYAQLFARVSCVLCEGPRMASRVISFGCPESKLRVLHLGVPLDRLPYRPRAWSGEGPLRVLIAASFREKKGIPYALEALGRVQRELSLEITVIGDTERDPLSVLEKERILSVVRKHAFARLRMLGYQPHARLLDEAYAHHVFLAPSITAENGDSEGGLPVTLLEMAATGMPIISTDHGDIPEQVQHQVTGLLTAERDVEGLMAQLRWLADHRERWPAMLDAGRRRIEAEFDARRQGERLAAIYRAL